MCWSRLLWVTEHLSFVHDRHRRRFWHATHDCVAPYVDIILNRGWFWAKSAASGSVRWCCFISCWTVLSHVMRGRPSSLLQCARGEANRILLASALSSMRIICPNTIRRRHWVIAVSLGCFVSLHTSSFRTNWYHLMPSSIRRHHWSSASILRASVFDIVQQSEPHRTVGKIHMLCSCMTVALYNSTYLLTVLACWTAVGYRLIILAVNVQYISTVQNNN